MSYINFTIGVEQADVSDVIAALSVGYQATISDANGNDIANPESQSEYANRTCRQWITKMVCRYRKSEAAKLINAEVDLIDPAMVV